MLKRVKINHWLSVYFLIYGVPLLRSLWYHSTATIPFLFSQPPLDWSVNAFKLVGSSFLGLKFWWLATVLVTSVRMFRGDSSSRWLGLFLAGLLPISHLVSGLLFGAATVLTWKSLSVSLSAVLVFWVLWRSRQIDELFGRDAKAARAAWIGLAVICLTPVALFGGVSYIRAKYHIPSMHRAAPHVYSSSEQIESGFSQRELLHVRIAVPADARVAWASAKAGKTSVGVLTPDESIFGYLSTGAIGESMADERWGRVTGLTNPYAIHRHMLRSRWSIIFVTLQGIMIPYVSGATEVRFIELYAPRWKGLGTVSLGKETTNAEYTLYSVDDPHRSATCLWHLRDSKTTIPQIEKALGSFEFLTTRKTAEQYVTEAHQARTVGQPLDAQFALTQAYLLSGGQDLSLTKELVEISAELGSWLLVKRLGKELLDAGEQDAQINALYDKAVAIQERKKEKTSGM